MSESPPEAARPRPPRRTRAPSPLPLRMLRPEVLKGKTLMVPVYDNPPPSRSNNFAGRHLVRYFPKKPLLDAFEFQGTILPENLKPRLEDLLVDFCIQIIFECYIVHNSGAIGSCRDCYICKYVLPEMYDAIKPQGDFHTKGIIFSERVLVPALKSALESCGRYCNATWAEDVMSLLGELCWLLENEFPTERHVWEQLIQVFARKGVEEITTERLSEKWLDEEGDRIMERLCNGEADNLFLYALKADIGEDDLGWGSSASASDADDELGMFVTY